MIRVAGILLAVVLAAAGLVFLWWPLACLALATPILLWLFVVRPYRTKETVTKNDVNSDRPAGLDMDGDHEHVTGPLDVTGREVVAQDATVENPVEVAMDSVTVGHAAPSS
jgi:hypothetical protein